MRTAKSVVQGRLHGSDGAARLPCWVLMARPQQDCIDAVASHVFGKMLACVATSSSGSLLT